MTDACRRSIWARAAVLALEGIHTYYGPAHVLFDVSLRVEPGQIVCLLGRNGVGKTTCMRTIMALTPARRGTVRFNGEEISRLAPFQIARRGIGYVPEDRRIFPDVTVRDNLEIGQIRRKRDGGGWNLERAYDVFPQLRSLEDRLGGQLSGGEQQMLTIARTLMGNPRLVLLDEPTEGLSPLVVRSLYELILDLKGQGLTMFLAAQDVRFVTEVGDYIYVMKRGRIVYGGSSKQARSDEALVKAHLAI